LETVVPYLEFNFRYEFVLNRPIHPPLGDIKILSKSIGPMENLAVYTNACKGLEVAVAKVFPNIEQRECFRHLMENMKKFYS